MKQRQYFDYIDTDGHRHTWLCMPNEVREAKHYASELGWTLKRYFEARCIFREVKEVILKVEYMDEEAAL